MGDEMKNNALMNSYHLEKGFIAIDYKMLFCNLVVFFRRHYLANYVEIMIYTRTKTKA